MKNSKKISGLFLAILMVLPLFTMGISAAAAEPAVKPGDVLYAEDFEGKTSTLFTSHPTTAYPGKANMSIKNGQLYVEKGTDGWALYDVVPADRMKGLKKYTLSYDLQYIAGSGNLGDIGFIFGDTDKNAGDGNWVAHNWLNCNIDPRYYENGKKVWYARMKNPDISNTLPTHTDIIVDMVAKTATVEFTHTLKDGTVKTNVFNIPTSRVPAVAGSIRFITSNDGSAILDNVKVVNNENNAVVYENNFGAFTTTSTKYKGQFDQTYVDFNGGQAINLKTNEWSYHKIVDKAALQGQTHYTISYTVKLNAASQFGVAFGGYSDGAYCGHKLWIKGGSDGWVGDEVHDAAGKSIRAAKNANFGAPLINEEFIRVIIDVNAATKQMRYYFNGSSKSVNMGGRDTLGTVDSIYLFTRGTADVILDDFVVTAGGYGDLSNVKAVGYQTSAVNNGKYGIRFVSSIQGKLENTSKVGMEIKVYTGETNGRLFDMATATVYNSIMGGGETVKAEAGSYLFGIVIDNIPVGTAITKIVYTPYMISNNGVRVNGTSVTVNTPAVPMA